MDKTAVVKVGAVASASVCVLFGGVVLAQYIVAKKKRAGKKTKIIEMNNKTGARIIPAFCSICSKNP